MRSAIALGAGLALLGSMLIAIPAYAESPIGCSADNSVVNISSDKIAAEEGETITFTVEAGNPTSVNGCDITNRTMTLTLPDGSTVPFGPVNYPNGTAVAVVGSAPYIANSANLSGGFWVANVTWDGTLKAVSDQPSTGSKNAVVNEVEDLEVSKTAVPSFERRITWTIDKSVDIDEHNLLTGQSGESTYTVALVKNVEEAGYKVDGVITIHNPNDTESATIASVGDVISGYGNADTVNCGVTFPHVLAAGGTLECTYSSSLPDDTTRTNTATVVTSGFIDGGSGEASVDFTGVNPTLTGFETVNVTDTVEGSLGSFSDSGNAMYTREFICDADEGNHPNTATIVETQQSDDAFVDVICSTPSVTVEKTGAELSKIGDEATYTFLITNTGDTTLYLESIVDDKIGDLTNSSNYDSSTCGASLAPAGSCTIISTITIPGDASDPFINTVDVTYDTAEALDGFEATASDNHETELFQPSVEIVKSGPSEAAVGDEITYSFTINNTSSSDSPDLLIDSIVDNVIGDLSAEASGAGCDTLAQGSSCNFNVNYTIDAGDPSPLVNTVVVHYHPAEFPNDITDDDSHTLNIIQLEFAGCTPGFWKNNIEGVWETYAPTNEFINVFGVSSFSIGKGKKGVLDPNLLEALNANGGGIDALARHAVAALLNAAHGDVAYPWTEAQIISAVQAAFASEDYESLKNQLAGFNEEGCSIDAHGNPITE